MSIGEARRRHAQDPGGADAAERLAAVAAASRAGASAAEAWSAWGPGDVHDARRAIDPDGAPRLEAPEPLATELRAAGRLAQRSGIPLAEVLDALGDVERARRSGELARQTALAGPRASARLLAWLPLAGFAFAAVVETGVVRLVIATPLGWALLAIGACLTALGRWWMAAALASAERAGGSSDPAPGPAALSALLGAGVRCGLDVRTALALVAEAAGPTARPLAAAASELGAGASWNNAWRDLPAQLAPIARCLAPAWERGASPVAALAASAEAIVQRDAARSQAAAAELGVRLSLPLALCLLPAFVVVGIVPLLLAVGGSVIADLGGVGSAAGR